MSKREKVWLRAYEAYMKSDAPMKNTRDASYWANSALDEYDKQFQS